MKSWRQNGIIEDHKNEGLTLVQIEKISGRIEKLSDVL